MHGDSPGRLDHSLPDLRKDDSAVRSHKVVVAVKDVWPKYSNVEESLFDERFHTL